MCSGRRDLGQVQADEMYVRAQGGRLWMATAMSVFARLFVWGGRWLCSGMNTCLHG